MARMLASRVCVLLALLPVPGVCRAEPPGSEPDRYFAIEVVDGQTGRGVPMVELQTTYGARYDTDSAELIDFAKRWDRTAPLVIHCFAGISRSTAAAFIAACALAPGRDEDEFARRIRQASPTASPNPRLVALGDSYLQRQGRMVNAVSRMGPGVAAYEAEPFDLKWD